MNGLGSNVVLIPDTGPLQILLSGSSLPRQCDPIISNCRQRHSASCCSLQQHCVLVGIPWEKDSSQSPCHGSYLLLQVCPVDGQVQFRASRQLIKDSHELACVFILDLERRPVPLRIYILADMSDVALHSFSCQDPLCSLPCF